VVLCCPLPARAWWIGTAVTPRAYCCIHINLAASSREPCGGLLGIR
jgi:hypothetical protein